MKRKAIVALISVVAVASVGLLAVGQVDLGEFPVGSTRMVYAVRSEDVSESQTMELTVAVYGDDQYKVRMVMETIGNEDELAAGFGFIFGSTSVSSGSGQDADYSSLQALMDQRQRLEEGQNWALPGGDFVDIIGVEIAGVWCLEGTIVYDDDPNSRMFVAFSLTNPVYISPRIRVEELRTGEWVETFALELVEYTFDESGG